MSELKIIANVTAMGLIANTIILINTDIFIVEQYDMIAYLILFLMFSSFCYLLGEIFYER